MKLIEKSKDKLMAMNPTEYGTHVNVLGQKTTFLEHPIHGDGSEVLALIEADDTTYLVNTDFFDTEDLTNPEYEVLIWEGRPICGFEFMEEA